MFEKFKNLLKRMFIHENKLIYDEEKNENNKNENIVKEFNLNYEKIKSSKDINTFHKLAIDIVLKRLEKTNYGKHKDFMREIKYLLHYVFLILYDDYFYGDKVFQKKITEIDNYIFSSYRRMPKLAKNIKKLSLLAYSNRFTKKPKENILSYLVFLEEQNIEITEIFQDYSSLLEEKDNAVDLFFNVKENKLKKTYSKNEKKDLTQNTNNSIKTLYSIAPTLQETSKTAKFKIYKDYLDKE